MTTPSTLVEMIGQKFPGAATLHDGGWVVLNKEALRPVFDHLKNGPLAFTSLHGLTAVDRKETVEVVYHLFSFKERSMVIFKVILPAGELHVDSLTPLWAGADWLEREVFDLFGVRFDGHPDLRRIMNPESWTGHPLRKDFKHPDLILKPVK